MIIYMGNNWNPRKLATVEAMPDKLRLMYTPIDFQRDKHYPFALDNGAFGAFMHEQPFDALAFLTAMKRLPGADFVVIPDKIAAGQTSLEYSVKWRAVLPDGPHYYLAVQDGMKQEKIPSVLRAKISGLFVGGTIEWKLATMAEWVAFAHEHDLKCHVGRIGTLERIMQAERLRVDSVDSSNLARHDYIFDEVMQWINGEHKPMEHFTTMQE